MKFARAILASMGATLLLAGCSSEAEGEPVVRAEIGMGNGEGSEIVEMPTPQPNSLAVSEPAAGSACRQRSFDGKAFTHCIADPEIHRIRSVLNGENGKPLRSMRAYSDELGRQSDIVVFAVNGGMFKGDGAPVGYLVEEGERLNGLNRGSGESNFFMKPNGVFFGTEGKWDIFATEWFFTTVGTRPQFGTQSGPMLVIEGKLHPEIAENGPSKAVRNGVGIGKDGKAHFVLSEEAVSFGQLARFFRDELKTPNALFLDSNVSALWDPATERIDVGAPLGPMLVVYKRKGNSP
jgi:uncharacterized protein YigE (DUF2233 family)